MTEYRIARPGEEEAILDFINLVFSQAHEPHHFNELLSKVYAHDDYAPIHYIACTDGHIRAAVALKPMTLQMDADHALKLGFIGSVSVHERYRGEGHMKALMKMALEDARAQGYDLLTLGGQRQRYGYWGFECGGAALSFHIGAANIRHALKDVACDQVKIRKITDENDAALDAIYAMSVAQKMICHRERDRFLEIMQSWYKNLYALEVGGNLAGYYYGDSGSIQELVLENEDDLLPVIKAWMQGRNHGSITVPMHLAGRAQAIKAFAESYTVEDAHMFLIYNWAKVLKAALEVKHGYAPLPSGRFVFEVEDEGRFAVSMEDGHAQVTETEDAAEMTFTRQKAVEFFFSPFSAFYAPNALLKSWLPLPMDIPGADGF